MSEIDVLNFTVAGFSIGTLSKVALVLIMVSMGLTLKLQDFRLVVESPKQVAVGLLGQVMLLPAVGLALSLLLSMPAEIAMGLIIIAACPGGATSNFMTYLARGDVALSVVLTAISGLVAVVTLPYIVDYGLTLHGFAERGFRLPILASIWNICMLTLVPVAGGMCARSVAPRVADRLERYLTPLSFICLIVIMLLIARQVWPNLGAMLKSSLMPVLALNAVMIAVGITLGKVFGLLPRIQRTLAIEIGFQNYTLGVVVALVLLQSPEMTIAPVVYLFSMYITASVVVLWGRRVSREEKQTAPVPLAN